MFLVSSSSLQSTCEKTCGALDQSRYCPWSAQILSSLRDERVALSRVEVHGCLPGVQGALWGAHHGEYYCRTLHETRDQLIISVRIVGKNSRVTGRGANEHKSLLGSVLKLLPLERVGVHLEGDWSR